MALTFLRHTTPDVAKGMCYGVTDLNVADTFEAEVSAVLAGLPKVGWIVSSPLLRCRMLAEQVAKHWGADVQVIDGLHEMDFGRWEMVPWDDIPRVEIDDWAADFMGARPHGGESVQQLQDRVAETLEAIPDGALVVTHSGVIRAAAVLADHSQGWRMDVKYGRWVTLPG